VTRFTKFGLGIRKSIYFSFGIFFKRILRKTIKTSASKHLEDARGCYCGDTRGYLVCIGWICWQSFTHKSHCQVRSIILAIQLKADCGKRVSFGFRNSISIVNRIRSFLSFCQRNFAYCNETLPGIFFTNCFYSKHIGGSVSLQEEGWVVCVWSLEDELKV